MQIQKSSMELEISLSLIKYSHIKKFIAHGLLMGFYSYVEDSNSKLEPWADAHRRQSTAYDPSLVSTTPVCDFLS